MKVVVLSHRKYICLKIAEDEIVRIPNTQELEHFIESLNLMIKLINSKLHSGDRKYEYNCLILFDMAILQSNGY